MGLNPYNLQKFAVRSSVGIIANINAGHHIFKKYFDNN